MSSKKKGAAKERRQGSRKSERVFVISFSVWRAKQLTLRSARQEDMTAKVKEYAGGHSRPLLSFCLPLFCFAASLDIAISSSDSDDELMDFRQLTAEKKRKAPEPTVTPVRARFSLESLADEESTRKKVAVVMEGGDPDSDPEALDMEKVFGADRAEEFRRIIDEARHKTIEDLDLQSFFHRWTAESRADFFRRGPVRLPECLASMLAKDNKHAAEGVQNSPEMMRLILCGDWIPSLFPESCPAELAQWLFSCICFAEEDAVSAAAWDAWTYYFGRRGLWDPDDASFSWFRDGQQSQRAAIEWVPVWKDVVDTLAAFGGPVAPYQSGIAHTPDTATSAVRDDPPVVDRLLRPAAVDAALLASFPATQLRRFFSVMGLCLYASTWGRLFRGGQVYDANHASLLIQICFACLVDPLLVSSAKRELTQCIGAAVEVFSDDHQSIVTLCSQITFLAPRGELEPIVSALGLFQPSTRRAQWLRRCLGFWVSSLMLKQRIAECHPTQQLVLSDMHKAMFGPAEMLGEMCVFLEALQQSLKLVRCKAVVYMWLFRLLVCLDLTLGDRSAITASETDVTRVSDLLKQLQDSFRQGEEMNEFASASRTAIGLMKERIEYNVRFEKNKAESIRTEKAAARIGSSGGKQAELNFTPIKRN